MKRATESDLPLKLEEKLRFGDEHLKKKKEGDWARKADVEETVTSKEQELWNVEEANSIEIYGL